MISFVKKHKKILGVIIFVVLIIAFSIYFGEKEIQQEAQMEEPEETEFPSSSIKTSENLSAGESNLEDLDILGDPAETEQNEDGTETLIYGSTNDPQPTTVVVDNNEVLFIKKRPSLDDPNNLNQFINEHGSPEAEFFTEYVGFKAYVFLQKGLSVTAGEGGSILELRYFIPTSKEEFLNTWGKDFSETPPPIPPLYY